MWFKIDVLFYLLRSHYTKLIFSTDKHIIKRAKCIHVMAMVPCCLDQIKHFFPIDVSDVSAYGSKQRYLLRECFWLIVITEEWTMRKTPKSPGEKIVKDIKRATRKHYSSEEKIRIVLDGLRGEDSIAELCRREGIAHGIYYKWSKDFMEAGKKRLAGDTARSANTDEVKELRREAKDLKEVVAEQTLELRLLKKSMYGGGGDHE